MGLGIQDGVCFEASHELESNRWSLNSSLAVRNGDFDRELNTLDGLDSVEKPQLMWKQREITRDLKKVTHSSDPLKCSSISMLHNYVLIFFFKDKSWEIFQNTNPNPNLTLTLLFRIIILAREHGLLCLAIG